MSDERSDDLKDIADGLAVAMLRLCLCGICENSRNPDEGEVYYFGGRCDHRLLCCLGGHRHPLASCSVRRLEDHCVHKALITFDLRRET